MKKIYIVCIALLISIAFLSGCTESDNTENDEEYNFRVMRDIFTTSGFDDTIKIECIGYHQFGGFVYWVNHSQVCNSFFFNDMHDYKILIPLNGRIQLLN